MKQALLLSVVAAASTVGQASLHRAAFAGVPCLLRGVPRAWAGPSSPTCGTQLSLRGGAPLSTSVRMSGGEQAMQAAILAVADAAKAARSVAGSLSKDMSEGTLGKKDTSPVTVGDFAVQAIVCKRLMDTFPNDEIIAEENADELRKPEKKDLLERVVTAVRSVEPDATAEQVCDWIDRGVLREYRDRFWTLDPIDGTKGFLRREQYALCLALVEKGEPTVAAMACPNAPQSFEQGESRALGVLFSGYKGGGCWSQDLPEGGGAKEAARLAASRKRHMIEAKAQNELRFCESVEAAHSNHDTAALIAMELGITAPPLRLDSQVKYGVMSRGDAEVYLRLPASSGNMGSTYIENIWDHAAGCLLMQEAGGIVSDMNGKPLDFRHGPKLTQNKGVVASCSPELHKKVVAAVAKHAK